VRVVLAIAGSMTFEGEVIGWVATHHRHHAIVITPSSSRRGAGRNGAPVDSERRLLCSEQCIL
jgi:hypothetical protein